MAVAKRSINDYWMIYGKGGKRLEPRDTLKLHLTAVRWLDAELSKPFDGKTVVVTHFAPHRGCVPPQYEGSEMSPYFVTDLSRLMKKHQISVWCHGHTHTNTDFLAEGGCRVISACRMGLAKFWMAPKAAVISRKKRKQSQTARTPRNAKGDPAG